MGYDLIIVGAGLSGLSAALEAEKAGLKTCLLEASDSVGGRIKTVQKEGFLLDKGFQVFLTHYPTARKLLNYQKLELAQFASGAHFLTAQFQKKIVANPLKKPQQLFNTLFSGAFSIKDLSTLLRLGVFLNTRSGQTLLGQDEISTQSYFDNYFSKRFQTQFLQPFFRGIFLDASLNTSHRLFLYYLQAFLKGSAALPKAGMQAIPLQLAQKLKQTKIILNSKVIRQHHNSVIAENGETFTGKSILFCCSQHALSPLFHPANTANAKGVWVVYYKAEKQYAFTHKYLYLNGSGSGFINHIACLDSIQASYAPADQSLLSITLLAHPELPDISSCLEKIQQELPNYLGKTSQKWIYLDSFWIPDALPAQRFCQPSHQPKQLNPYCFHTGDWQVHGSIEGALVAGIHSINFLKSSGVFT